MSLVAKIDSKKPMKWAKIRRIMILQGTSATPTSQMRQTEDMSMSKHQRNGIASGPPTEATMRRAKSVLSLLSNSDAGSAPGKSSLIVFMTSARSQGIRTFVSGCTCLTEQQKHSASRTDTSSSCAFNDKRLLIVRRKMCPSAKAATNTTTMQEKTNMVPQVKSICPWPPLSMSWTLKSVLCDCCTLAMIWTMYAHMATAGTTALLESGRKASSL